MPIGYGEFLDWYMNDVEKSWIKDSSIEDPNNLSNKLPTLTVPAYKVTLRTFKPTELKMPKMLPEIKSVIFNEEKGFTTILWADGTSTVVHCGDGEKFERYEGFVMAIAKKLFGSTSAAKKEMDNKDVGLQKELKILRAEEALQKQRQKEAEAHQRRIQKEAARIMRDKEFMAEVREELKKTYGEDL